MMENNLKSFLESGILHKRFQSFIVLTKNRSTFEKLLEWDLLTDVSRKSPNLVTATFSMRLGVCTQKVPIDLWHFHFSGLSRAGREKALLRIFSYDGEGDALLVDETGDTLPDYQLPPTLLESLVPCLA